VRIVAVQPGAVDTNKCDNAPNQGSVCCVECRKDEAYEYNDGEEIDVEKEKSERDLATPYLTLSSSPAVALAVAVITRGGPSRFISPFSLLPSESQTATSVMEIRRVQSGWHR
jgi:hypothetical protein